MAGQDSEQIKTTRLTTSSPLDCFGVGRPLASPKHSVCTSSFPSKSIRWVYAKRNIVCFPCTYDWAGNNQFLLQGKDTLCIHSTLSLPSRLPLFNPSPRDFSLSYYLWLPCLISLSVISTRASFSLVSGPRLAHPSRSSPLSFHNVTRNSKKLIPD